MFNSFHIESSLYFWFKTLASPKCPSSFAVLPGNLSRNIILRPVLTLNRSACSIFSHARTGGWMPPDRAYFRSLFWVQTWYTIIYYFPRRTFISNANANALTLSRSISPHRVRFFMESMYLVNNSNCIRRVLPAIMFSMKPISYCAAQLVPPRLSGLYFIICPPRDGNSSTLRLTLIFFRTQSKSNAFYYFQTLLYLKSILVFHTLSDRHILKPGLPF